MNKTCGWIEPSFYAAYCSIMEIITVDSFQFILVTYTSHHDILNLSSVKIRQMNGWLVTRWSQITNRLFGGNINSIRKQIRGIGGFFVPDGTLIYGHGRNNQIWDTTIRCKGIIEAVINYPVILLSRINFLVPFCSEIPWNIRMFESVTRISNSNLFPSLK